jgi:hypothetical protein
MNSKHGLIHLVNKDGELDPLGPVYSRGIPKVSCHGMWIDPKRNLWFETGSGKLDRIRLP